MNDAKNNTRGVENIINDLKYEEEKSGFSKVFDKLRRKESKTPVYDSDLPDLSKTIVSNNKILSENPMQDKNEKPNYDLPVLRMSKNIENSTSPNSAVEQKKEKVDISKVTQTNQDYNNEKIVYLQNIQKPEQRVAETAASPVQENKSETEAIIGESKNNSFFTALMQHINSENELLTDKKYVKSEILTKNLLTEMKDHWQTKKEEIKLDIKNKEAQAKIIEKIGELQKLESEWQIKELMIEEYKKQLEFVEKLIEEKGIELKKAVKSARFGETAKNPFIFSSGKAARSINELLDTLKATDSISFNEHVNDLRNDFASWIQNEFSDEALSKRVKDAYSRDDLIAILEMF